MTIISRATNAVNAGLAAARSAWRGNFAVLNSNQDWDTYDARMTRYGLNDLYYNNLQYDSLNKNVMLLKKSGRLYTHIRSIYNPVARVANIYADKIYPASIDFTGLDSGAIPVTGTPEIIEALTQLFRWSNWNIGKTMYVRTAEKLGDVFIKVVDDVEGGRVTLEVLDPQKVKYVSKDGAGNIKELWLEYPDWDNDKPAIYSQSKPTATRYIVTEVITPERVTLYRDGRQVDQWDNPWGFVPAVHAVPMDEGRAFGVVRWNMARGKIDEINSQAALLNDSVRKNVIPYLFTQGFTLDPTSIQRSETNMDEVLTFGAPKDGGEAKFLAPNVDIPSALDNIMRQMDELKEDMPELFLYKLSEQAAPSGVALRQMYDLSVSKITSAMGVYDDALTRACQMAMTIGGVQRYRGFEPFSLQSYELGALDFTIRPRPIFYEGMTDEKRIELLMSSGAPQSAVWSVLGVSEMEQAEWVQGLSEANEAALMRQVERMTLQADTEDDGDADNA